MRIHLLAATLVLGLAIQAELPNGVRALLVLTVVTVVALETMNTALERAVNLVTVEYHPLAKQAKDLAAAAVLLAALGSLGVAWFVWVEHRQALLAVLMTLQNPHWVQWVWIALMLAQITAIIRWREPQ